MKKLLYSLALAMCVQTGLWAQDTFYVSSMGDDTNPGTEEEPFYSLNPELLTDGCTVIVLDEIYVDPVVIMGDKQNEPSGVNTLTVQGGSPEAALIGLNDEEWEDEANECYSAFFDLKGGNLTLKDITLKNLRRVDGHNDGAMIFVDSYSELHMENVIIKNTDTPLSIRGGAISCSGKLYATNCTFENLKAYQGGAFYFLERENPLFARFDNCVFRGNQTVDGAADKGNGAGGAAFYIEGYEMDLAFDKCLFEHNQALNTNNNATGGALRIVMKGDESIPADAVVTFSNTTFAENYSAGASGMIHWGRPTVGDMKLKFINDVFYKNRTSGPQANILTGQGSAIPNVSGALMFVNCTSFMNNTGVGIEELGIEPLVLPDQNAINLSDFTGDFDMVWVNNLMLDCMIDEAIIEKDGKMVDEQGWGWSIREADGRCTGQYIIQNNVHDGVGGSYQAEWGAGFLWNFNDPDTSTANNNKSVRGKTTDQKLEQLGLGRTLVVPEEGVPYVAIESAEGFAIDNGVASLIYEGEELIPQTDIRGVAISGVSRDLGAFEFDGDGSAVDVNEVASAVRVYPNPVGDVMYLTDEAASVKVYSVCGACVAEAYNASSLNVASLPQGVYIVKIEMEDGSVYSNKIQK